MFPSLTIPKGKSMKTSTSKSAWVKASTNSIDLVGNSFILAISNRDLTLIKFTTGE